MLSPALAEPNLSILRVTAAQTASPTDRLKRKFEFKVIARAYVSATGKTYPRDKTILLEPEFKDGKFGVKASIDPHPYSPRSGVLTVAADGTASIPNESRKDLIPAANLLSMTPDLLDQIARSDKPVHRKGRFLIERKAYDVDVTLERSSKPGITPIVVYTTVKEKKWDYVDLRGEVRYDADGIPIESNMRGTLINFFKAQVVIKITRRIIP